MPPSEDQHEMKRMLREYGKLLEENNKLVKRLYHWTIAGSVLRVVWYALLIGLPFALYFYILQPYFEAFGSNYDTFESGLNELPGLKWMQHVMTILLGK